MKTQPVSSWSLYRKMGGAVPWIVLVCLIIIAATFALTGTKAEQLDTDRIESVATITDAKNYWGTSTTSRYSVLKVDIEFTFETQDGETIRGERHNPDATGEATVGEIFPVWYSHSQPELYELSVGHQQRNTSAIRWLAVIFTTLIGGFFVFQPYLHAKHLIKIRDEGVPVEATVREASNKDVELGRGELLHWHVKGMQPTFSEFPVPESDRPQPGTMITVYQLNNESVWEGDVG